MTAMAGAARKQLGRRGMTVLVVLSVVVGALALPASAVHYQASLEGSKFQIENNANIKYDTSTATDYDWGNTSKGSWREDAPTGRDDDSYSGGVKEDTTCPSETTGSIPNNKSDLRWFGIYHEASTTPGDDGFLHLFWTRVADPSGTTLMDFEFNQSQVRCAGGPNVERTPNDMLIEYSITQGGAQATMTIRRWTGSAWGTARQFSQNEAIGTVNTAPIAAGDSAGLVPSGSTQARTFGEASIDLDAIFTDEACQSFGSAMLKSRSSDSFTSQLKDFIDPVPITLTNCGSLDIKKTDAGGNNLAGAKFKVYEDKAPLGTFGSSDTLVNNSAGLNECTTTSDGIGDCIYTNLLIGKSFWVQETQAPAGYQPDTTPRLIAITSTTRTRSTWVNQPSLGNLTITKTDDAGNLMDNVTFTLTGTSTTGASVNESCVTGVSNNTGSATPAAGTCSILNVPIGTNYTLTETNVPAGYGPDSTFPRTGVAITAGQTVQVSATNPKLRGDLTVTKRDDSGTLMDNITFTLSGTSTAGDVVNETCTTGVSNSSGTATPATGTCSFLNIPIGTYTLSEGAVPPGYGSDPDFPLTGVVISAGTTVPVAAENPKLRGSLTVTKRDDGGTLMDGVQFTLSGTSTTGEAVSATCTTGTSNSSGTATPATGTCSFVNILVGTYTLDEGAVPSGYGKDSAFPQQVTIADGQTVQVAATNPKLRGNLTITKTDDAANLMDGIEFTLSGTSTTGEAVSATCVTGTSNSSGSATPAAGTCSFLNILVGSYTLSEGNVPAGYAKDSSLPKTVTITSGGTATVDVTNPRLHKVIVVVCHEGTNTLAPSDVTLGNDSVTSIGSPPGISGATPAAVEAALCALQGFGGKGHGNVTPSVDVGSDAHS